MYSFQGLYIGGVAGYGYANDVAIGSRSTLTTIRGFGTAVVSDWQTATAQDGDGFFGGGQVGYNFQTGAFVIGVEADINGSDISLGSVSTRTLAPRAVDETDFVAGTTSASADVDWYGTLRGRLGIVAGGNTLIYATGGLAYGEVSFAGTSTLRSSFDDNLDRRTARTSFNTSSNETGWTAGGGFDVMLTPNIVFGGSYQYVDLGDFSATSRLVEGRIIGGGQFLDEAEVRSSASADASFHAFMARLSYKFGGRAPAQYASASEPLK
jgi:outer membrane immunogenic protein